MTAIVLLLAASAVLALMTLLLRRREQAQARLLASERRFRLMTESVSDYAIVMLDARGRVQTWNTGARLIEGYDGTEIAGRHFGVFFTPEDRDVELPARALATVDAQGRFVHEAWLVRKDGTRFRASVVIGGLDDAGDAPGYCLIARDLTELNKARDAEHAREMSARLIAVQEEERRRVARELHDETGQSLTTIRMCLARMARAKGPEAPACEAATTCMAEVDKAIAQIRSISLRLRPTMLDDLGLVDALQWMLEDMARSADWSYSMDAPELERRLPQEVETACFRIAQEALTNAARHADAAHVHLSLHVANQRVDLEVRDDGLGFEPARYASPEERSRHFGMVSMAERAALAGGCLQVESAPGKGTCVCASLPIRT